MAVDHALVEALVALASRDGLGEQVAWDEVRAAIFALEDAPLGARDLRAILKRVNNPDVLDTLHDWFLRAASEREQNAEDASRAAQTVLTPFQRVSLAPMIAGLVGAVTGSFGAAIAVPLVVASLCVFAVATGGLWRLSKRSDDAQRDARALHRLAQLVDTRKT